MARDDLLAIALAVTIFVLALPVLLWFALAVFGGEGCAWIAGIGGCLPP